MHISACAERGPLVFLELLHDGGGLEEGSLRQAWDLRFSCLENLLCTRLPFLVCMYVLLNVIDLS